MLVAFSGVQTATGHRSDIRAISAIARAVGAIVFVDGSQLVGALPVAEDLGGIDVLATADHKFLLHAGRGLGYCYLSREIQERFVPINAGWKAGRVPFESFFGPAMDLSPTASRFDNSISWLAAIGNEAALSVFDGFGADAIYGRNRELAGLLRASLAEVGWTPVDLPEANRSSIVSVPLGDSRTRALLAELKRRGVVCSARDGNLRLAVHFYNHEDDIDRISERALPNCRSSPIASSAWKDRHVGRVSSATTMAVCVRCPGALGAAGGRPTRPDGGHTLDGRRARQPFTVRRWISAAMLAACSWRSSRSRPTLGRPTQTRVARLWPASCRSPAPAFLA